MLKNCKKSCGVCCGEPSCCDAGTFFNFKDAACEKCSGLSGECADCICSDLGTLSEVECVAECRSTDVETLTVTTPEWQIPEYTIAGGYMIALTDSGPSMVNEKPYWVREGEPVIGLMWLNESWAFTRAVGDSFRTIVFQSGCSGGLPLRASCEGSVDGAILSETWKYHESTEVSGTVALTIKTVADCNSPSNGGDEVEFWDCVKPTFTRYSCTSGQFHQYGE